MYICNRVALSYLTILYQLLELYDVEVEEYSVQFVKYSRFFVQAG
jgi:hypothetical protein